MNTYSTLISIIVPVYNVEKYLVPCVDSILQQTYQNFELLLIDDGSTDQSGNMCDELGQRDMRIKVYHKANGGLSDARNYGMEYVQGDYITFIDSDDTVSTRFLESLFSVAEENNADIAQCQFTLQEEKLDTGSNKLYSYNNEEALRQFLLIGKVYVAAWGKLYKRKLFNEIRYPYGRINEDSCTTYKTVYISQTVVCLDRALYWHRMREGSIMHTSFSGKNLEVLTVGNEIREFVSEQEPLFQNEINYFEYRTALGVLNFLLSSENYKQYREWGFSLKKQILSIDRKNPFLSIKDHCINTLLWTAPFIYRLMIRKHKERKSQGIKIR